MALKMDLHIHSTYSDGTLTPVELVKKYHEEEYTEIALTDHDGVGGVKEAQIAGEALGLKVDSGIELGTYLPDGTELHILGYYIDVENSELLAELEVIRNARKERNKKLLEVLQSMGCQLTEEDLQQRPGQDYIGKPNFALALAKKGYVGSPKEAFTPGSFLESPEAKKIQKYQLSPNRAIELIQGAGGIAALAHPMKVKGIGEKGSETFFQNLDDILRELKKSKLKALECFHPSASREQSLRLITMADKYKLHITQGSDYHGPEFQ